MIFFQTLSIDTSLWTCFEIVRRLNVFSGLDSFVFIFIYCSSVEHHVFVADVLGSFVNPHITLDNVGDVFKF